MAQGASSRRRVRRLLEQADFAAALAEIKGLPPAQTLKHLQASLAAGEPVVRWRAVTALGRVVAGLDQQHHEAAREFLRRLFWCLNEECGASPWGVAETLGEILASAPALAPEYADILLSYIHLDGPNFLDWPPLLAGAIWGVGRLAAVQPELLRQRGAAEKLTPHLSHPQAEVRGMAAWALGNLGQDEGRAALEDMRGDPSEVDLWREGALIRVMVGDLAREAIAKISDSKT